MSNAEVVPLPPSREALKQRAASCVDLAAEAAVASGMTLREFIDLALKWYRAHKR